MPSVLIHVQKTSIFHSLYHIDHLPSIIRCFKLIPKVLSDQLLTISNTFGKIFQLPTKLEPDKLLTVINTISRFVSYCQVFFHKFQIWDREWNIQNKGDPTYMQSDTVPIKNESTNGASVFFVFPNDFVVVEYNDQHFVFRLPPISCK